MGNSESSSSHRNNDESDEEQTSAASRVIKVGAAIAGTALLAFGAWNLASSSDSNENKSKKASVTDRSELFGDTSFEMNPGPEPESHTRYYGYLESASRSITVMSYNVWSREVEVAKRMEAIGQLIQKHYPDIIFFQEVTPDIYQKFQSSEWWKIYKCSVSPERATTRRYFCMLLSKLNVKRFKNEYFENSTKGIFWAELDFGSNKKLVVATSHLKSQTSDETYSSKRISQAKEALSLLNKFPNVVFGGDMNWDEDDDGLFPLDDGWEDAWTKLKPADNGWTYPKLKKRLDRFLCKMRNFKIIDIKVIGRKAIPGVSYDHNNKVNTVYPSDHCGLLLTISTDENEGDTRALNPYY